MPWIDTLTRPTNGYPAIHSAGEGGYQTNSGRNRYFDGHSDYEVLMAARQFEANGDWVWALCWVEYDRRVR